jgi:hypothetical protein
MALWRVLSGVRGEPRLIRHFNDHYKAYRAFNMLKGLCSKMSDKNQYLLLQVQRDAYWVNVLKCYGSGLNTVMGNYDENQG